MRFRAQQNRHNSMPEVNLVPMMDVIMTILTFFIILSMTMSNFQSVDVRLPGRGDAKGNAQKSIPVDPLIIGLNLQGQIRTTTGMVTRDQMIQQVRNYLGKNPQGVVILNADKAVPYEQVIQLLGILRDVGGDRVSLAIQ
jgi:biopolymer transport protein ExbD